jgi:hypothetical protein
MLLMIGRHFCFILILNLHPFHVSVCEVYHNSNTLSLEISMKIFIDDFELAIQNQGNTEFKLVNVNEKIIDNSPLKKYIIDRFNLKIDGKSIDLDLVGFEIDDDAVLCYFEGKNIEKIHEIEIYNAIISEVYDDQINLTHFQYNEEMKSFQTTKDNTKAILNTSGW